MFLLHTANDLRRLLRDEATLWLPDNLMLLQQYFPVEPAQGIVRMEFLGGKLLYAMRVISHGAFNLCPSEVCHPADDGRSLCAMPEEAPARPVEFYPYLEVPAAAVAMGERMGLCSGRNVVNH
ncbi:MAG TPA: hypothetical protein VH639_19880 [Bryobacteraceae bacterium]|jgi:hypothetical protein